jgi:hypothetical protein
LLYSKAGKGKKEGKSCLKKNLPVAAQPYCIIDQRSRLAVLEVEKFI